MDDLFDRVIQFLGKTNVDTYLDGRDPVALLQLELQTRMLDELIKMRRELDSMSVKLDIQALKPE